jgi:hypothetical protein
LAVTVTVTVAVVVLILTIPVVCEPAKSVTGMMVSGAVTDDAVAPPDDTGVAGGRGAVLVGASDVAGVDCDAAAGAGA